ncbi:hypothetical protein [Burkholderia cepacia]|uniref:hypothetical protein n=1 Tax=Burkholderia cepacia TaxID=292 RepID=UPI002AB60397|nr:hypothetical protein [Burkholderia cepacia]
MSAPFLDRSSVDTLKRALRNEFPTVKSAHLSEGLAFALGFQTHAALKAELVRPGANHPLPALNLRRLRERLSQLGYVNDDTFDSVQAKFEKQFPAWIETDTAAAERMAAVIGFDPSNLEAAVDAVMKSASEKGQELTFTGPAVRPVNLRDRRQVRDYIVEKVRQRYEDAKKRAGGVRIAQIEDVVYTPVGFVFERAVGEMHPPPFGVRDGEKVGHLAYFWSVL